eukprot:2956905-Prymnesium_polylepis.1
MCIRDRRWRAADRAAQGRRVAVEGGGPGRGATEDTIGRGDGETDERHRRDVERPQALAARLRVHGDAR